MHPIFLHVRSDGSLWVTSELNDSGETAQMTGNAVGIFRINGGTALAKVAVLTGSGNASASALAISASTPATGKNGQEVNKTH